MTSTPQKSQRDSTYVQLIAEAIMASTNGRLLLCEIYDWIEQHSPRLASGRLGEGSDAQRRRWKNSVRHNLSLNECFEIDPSLPAVPHKGNYWRINPAARQQFEQGNFARRRARQAATRHTRREPVSTVPASITGAYASDSSDSTGTTAFGYAGATESEATNPHLFKANLEVRYVPLSTLALGQGAAAFSPRELRALRNQGYYLPLGSVPPTASHIGPYTFTDEALFACIRDCPTDYAAYSSWSF